MKGSDKDRSQEPLSQRPDSKRKINYEGLLAYTDRSHKRDVKVSHKEESGKKIPLTAREPTKSTTDFTKIKDSEYILKASSKVNSNLASKKKLSIGSTESLSFKRKKFSLQTNSNVGANEKPSTIERPLTGSSLAAMAYGTSSGLLLKRSVLSTGTQEEPSNLSRNPQNIQKSTNTGSLSSRTYKANQEKGSLFMNAQMEYQRNTTNPSYNRINEEFQTSNLKNSQLLSKARLSKPDLKDSSTKGSRISLQTDQSSAVKKQQTSGALTDRAIYTDSLSAQASKKSNVLVRVNTANLVQASKFTKHISQNTQEKLDDKERSGLEKKVSSKLIIIGEDKAKKSTPDAHGDFLATRSRKSAIILTDSKQTSRVAVKSQVLNKEIPQKKEIKSILEEINLIKGKLDRSSERPRSNNKQRKSPLNKKPLY